MHHYKVLAKCGHVGDGKYCVKAFFIKARNHKDARDKVMKMPRVKKQLKGAIISVREVGSEIYMRGRFDMILDPYFRCTTDEELAEHIRKGYRLKTYYVSKSIKNKVKTSLKEKDENICQK